jgi:hypothetical protein
MPIRQPIPQDAIDLYDHLIATKPDLQPKGATMPYTSLNGHMFSSPCAAPPCGRTALSWPGITRAYVSNTAE